MQCRERVISGYLWSRIVVDEAVLIARHELADYCDTRIYIDKRNNPKYTSQWASSHKCGKPHLFYMGFEVKRVCKKEVRA